MNIASFVGLQEYMQLKLTCRAMNTHMPARLRGVYRKQHPLSVCCRNQGCTQDQIAIKQYIATARTDFNNTLHQIENDMEKSSKYFKPRTLRCTVCKSLKSRDCFIDSQRASVHSTYASTDSRQRRITRNRRVCIQCGIRRKVLKGKCYTLRDSILVNKKKMFVCHICRAVDPLEHKYTGESWKKSIIPSRHYKGFNEHEKSLLNACSECARMANQGTVWSEVDLKGIRANPYPVDN